MYNTSMMRDKRFRTYGFPGKQGRVVLESSDDLSLKDYSPVGGLGALGKVKLSADQKAQVKLAAQTALVARKIAKQNLALSKVTNKAALVAAKQQTKLGAQAAKQAVYAAKGATATNSVLPPAATESTALTPYSPSAPSAADFSSGYAGGGGGGGIAAPAIDPATGAPVEAAPNPLMTYLPWIAGAALVGFVLLRKKKR